MSKKKLIFSLVVASFSIVFCGTVNFANASSVVEVCRLDAKIINVTEEHVFVDITGIKIYNKSSILCADINRNSDYKIIRDNFLKNSYRESIFVGQNIIIDGVSGNAMGPDGPVYWDSWELESAGGKATKLPITLEKVSLRVTVDDADYLIEGNTYTVAELNSNTSTKARKFFTEAYVSYFYDAHNCRLDDLTRPIYYYGAVVSDNKQNPKQHSADTCINEASLYSKTNSESSFGYDKPAIILKEGQKYRFEISARNTSKTDVPKNEFALASVKNIDGSAVVSKTIAPPITDQPAKRSFFGRIWNWFAGLFKR